MCLRMVVFSFELCSGVCVLWMVVIFVKWVLGQGVCGRLSFLFRLDGGGLSVAVYVSS